MQLLYGTKPLDVISKTWFVTSFEYWSMWVLRGLSFTTDELMDYYKQFGAYMDRVQPDEQIETSARIAQSTSVIERQRRLAAQS